MDGRLEFICHTGELTVGDKIRTEGDVDIYPICWERGSRNPRTYELRYDRSAGRIMTDMSILVGNQRLPEYLHEECDTYLELFEQRFKRTFYGKTDFEVLVGGFDIHSAKWNGSSFMVDVTYHNSHGPGERRTLLLGDDPSALVQQVFELAGDPHLCEEMQAEAYVRIEHMHRALRPRLQARHPLAGQRENSWSERVYLPWSE